MGGFWGGGLTRAILRSNADNFGSDLVGITGRTGALGDLFSGDYRIVDVMQADYGAVGDGVQNDQPAIQAAVTYAAANNGAVFFPTPSASYKLDTDVTCPTTVPIEFIMAPGVHFTGVGKMPNRVVNLNHLMTQNYKRIMGGAGDASTAHKGWVVQSLEVSPNTDFPVDGHAAASVFAALGRDGVGCGIWATNFHLRFESGFTGGGICCDLNIDNYAADSMGTALQIDGVGTYHPHFAMYVKWSGAGQWDAGLRLENCKTGLGIDLTGVAEANREWGVWVKTDKNHIKLVSSDALVPANAHIFGVDTTDAIMWAMTKGGGVKGKELVQTSFLNGWEFGIKSKTTELTGLTGASVNWAGAITTGMMVLGVSARVTTLITGATGVDVGENGGDTDLFIDGMGVALGSVAALGNSNAAFTGPKVYRSTYGILVTAVGGDFTAGAIRLVLHYIELTPPGS